MKTLVLIFSVLLGSALHASIKFQQLRPLESPIATTDTSYLNYTIDTSRLTGIGWWDQRPALDLSDPKFKQLIDILKPQSIRIGGTGSDYLFYSVTPTPLDPHFQINFTKKKLDEISDFFATRNIELLFNLNGSKFFYQGDEFNTNQAELIFNYFKQSKLNDLVHFEFGNEVNAFWMIHGLREFVSPKRYAKAYDQVQKIKNLHNPNWKLLGPSHALWPKLGHPFGFIGGTLEDFLERTTNPEVASWHYYPAQSERCPIRLTKASIKNQITPKRLDEVKKYLNKIKSWRDKYSPSTLLWMSETGSAQCGGQPDVSDTFASTLWWLDQLAITAKYDHKRVYRQTIIGGDYGLIEEDTLRPRIDFWTSILWTRLMGEKVYDAKVIKKDKYLRTYAHSHPSGKGVVYLFINLGKEKSRRIDFNASENHKALVYKLSAKSLDAKEVLLNDQVINLESYHQVLSEVNEQEISGVNLEPFEAFFVHLK